MMSRSNHSPKKLWQLELLVRCTSGWHCVSPQVPGSQSSVAGGDQNSAAASADFALMFVCAML